MSKVKFLHINKQACTLGKLFLPSCLCKILMMNKYTVKYHVTCYVTFPNFQVQPQHLLTGAVMSAPAAVAIAKLNFPETEESYFKNDEDFDLDSG